MRETNETRRLGRHRGFDLFAQQRETGGWRVLAVLDRVAEDGSAERTAFIAEDPSLQVAEDTVKARVDRWSGHGAPPPAV
jgi:hypothetical protein